MCGRGRGGGLQPPRDVSFLCVDLCLHHQPHPPAPVARLSSTTSSEQQLSSAAASALPPLLCLCHWYAAWTLRRAQGHAGGAQLRWQRHAPTRAAPRSRRGRGVCAPHPHTAARCSLRAAPGGSRIVTPELTSPNGTCGPAHADSRSRASRGHHTDAHTECAPVHHLCRRQCRRAAAALRVGRQRFRRGALKDSGAGARGPVKPRARERIQC